MAEMIHAYRPNGTPWCGALVVLGLQVPVTRAFYRDLCLACRAEVAALCRRLAP